MRIRDPDLPLLHFAVAFRGAAWTDPDSIALMVMQTMIGAWDKNAGSGAGPRVRDWRNEGMVRVSLQGREALDQRGKPAQEGPDAGRARVQART